MKKLAQILSPFFILWLFLNDGSPSTAKELIWACLILFFFASIAATLGLAIVRLAFWVPIRMRNDVSRKEELLRIYAKTENTDLAIATLAVAILLGVPGYSQSILIAFITFSIGLHMSYILLYKGTIETRDSLNFDILKNAPKHIASNTEKS